MAKAKSTRIKGATKADKQQIAAARATNETNTKATAATPEAAPTPREQRDAAQALFDKADEDGQAQMIADASMRKAALGY